MNMKNLLAGLVLTFLVFVFARPVEAKSVSVRAYYKTSTHSYVAPSHRTAPNRTRFDNYSTKGNYNPYTGRIGAKSPY